MRETKRDTIVEALQAERPATSPRTPGMQLGLIPKCTQKGRDAFSANARTISPLFSSSLSVLLNELRESFCRVE